jgi:hypothetical protein
MVRIVMATIKRRTTIGFTKGNDDQLNELCDHFQESKSQIVYRALTILHYITFNTKRGANNESQQDV